MKKLIYIVVSIILFSIYLIYSYNNLKGKSYIFEPIYITLKGDIPEDTKLELIYTTINDPTTYQTIYPLVNDTIPGNTYIFKIDSSYRLSHFSIYFKSLREEELIITEIKASTDGKEFPFSLESKDLTATANLIINQLDPNTISLRKRSSASSSSAALSFNMMATFDEVFIRTSTRILEIPSPLAFVVIISLGILMALSLRPLMRSVKLERLSWGNYLLAVAVLIMPTGEKASNLIISLSLITGIIQVFIKGVFRTWMKANQTFLIIIIATLLVYLISFVFSRGSQSIGNLLAIKLGLPLMMMAIAINVNNRRDIEFQYTALLAGVIISIFLHFGWAAILIDSVANKSKLFSNPLYFLESSVFVRVHHSYISTLYLVSITLILFRKDLPPLRRQDIILYSLYIMPALFFAFSRAAVIALLLILAFYALQKLFQKLKLDITFVIRIITATVLTFALVLFIFFSSDNDSHAENFPVKGFDTRLTIWGNAADLIKQKPLLGWGPYGYENALKISNSHNIYDSNARRVLNTHNQFLETSGMFGLLVSTGLIWFLLFPTGFSRQDELLSRQIIYTSIIFISVFLFESFLNRNLGILIFGLIYGLIIKIKQHSIKLNG